MPLAETRPSRFGPAKSLRNDRTNRNLPRQQDQQSILVNNAITAIGFLACQSRRPPTGLPTKSLTETRHHSLIAMGSSFFSIGDFCPVVTSLFILFTRSTMHRLSLPIIDTSRPELGFARTTCSCSDCTIHWHYLPGYLLPSDLSRIANFHRPGVDFVSWASRYLLASPGAIVAKAGRAFRIPTLVPARRLDGACIFLTADKKRSIAMPCPLSAAYNSEKSFCRCRTTGGVHA
jgi:hypothetical protein